MKRTENRDPITNVRLEQPDLPVYMPGTPTASFMEYIELVANMLR
ncbi:hypothetical protein [Natrinema soli]|uniref:Uncharacterized protein n=1 Tax=Natrinema soli TaxID=1930624 RepID=A0ABD5SIN5_9EURY|nr:hypothetical protein [Natrinema soli]